MLPPSIFLHFYLLRYLYQLPRYLYPLIFLDPLVSLLLLELKRHTKWGQMCWEIQKNTWFYRNKFINKRLPPGLAPKFTRCLSRSRYSRYIWPCHLWKLLWKVSGLLFVKELHQCLGKILKADLFQGILRAFFSNLLFQVRMLLWFPGIARGLLCFWNRFYFW